MIYWLIHKLSQWTDPNTTFFHSSNAFIIREHVAFNLRGIVRWEKWRSADKEEEAERKERENDELTTWERWKWDLIVKSHSLKTLALEGRDGEDGHHSQKTYSSNERNYFSIQTLTKKAKKTIIMKVTRLHKTKSAHILTKTHSIYIIIHTPQLYHF